MEDPGWVRIRNVLRLAVMVAAALLLLPAIAQAAPITVTTTDDVSATNCTLRDAITAANTNSVTNACSAGSGDDVITVTATGTINLGSLLPSLESNIAINGPGASQLNVRRDSGGDYAVFTAFDSNPSAAVTSISDLTVSNGRLTGIGQAGAGIRNFESMTLDRVVVTGNSVVNTSAAVNPAPGGGGVFNGGLSGGSMTVRRSTVSANTVTTSQTAASGATSADAAGGGFYSTQPLTIERSTISGNTVSASVTSTDPGASAIARGAAILNFSSANLSLSTVSGNTATTTAPNTAERGALANVGGLTVTGSTIAFNTAANSANLSAQQGETVTNTIISDAQGGGPGCDGSVNVDGGFNIDEDASCTGLTAANVDPQLGPLAANGGPTLTHRPAATSPAIDQGTAATFSSDQREQPRPFDMPSVVNASDGSDVGAFEFQNSDFPLPTPPGPEPGPEPGPGDIAPPDTTITAGPEGKTKKKTASFTFSGTDARAVASFQCKLDDGSFEACSSPKTYSGLKKGSRTFSVRAVDAAGNVDPTPATRTWKVKKKKRK